MSIFKNIFHKKSKGSYLESQAPDELSISNPTLVSHDMHVSINKDSGEVEAAGLPDVWKKIIAATLS